MTTHYVCRKYLLESRAGLAGVGFEVDGRGGSRGAGDAAGVAGAGEARGAAAAGAGVLSACVIRLRAIIATLRTYYVQTCY